METGVTLPSSKGMAKKVQTRDEATKPDARCGNLAERRGAPLFNGRTFEESTSFEFQRDAKSRQPLASDNSLYLPNY
ncbi:hypothetical protein JOB18_000046 [Solea senegalensis]|uniref:Uncharacterized protein n=1 Tax=Solea senegalensis TaxID=28829 RepID=A0AAV6R5P0_SOLSE|nr:hypothetical protein JOB18_000046 [Solea senegalensis]